MRSMVMSVLAASRLSGRLVFVQNIFVAPTVSAIRRQCRKPFNKPGERSRRRGQYIFSRSCRSHARLRLMLDRVTAQVWPVSGSNEQVRRQIEEVRQSPRLPGINLALPAQNLGDDRWCPEHANQISLLEASLLHQVLEYLPRRGLRRNCGAIFVYFDQVGQKPGHRIFFHRQLSLGEEKPFQRSLASPILALGLDQLRRIIVLGH